MWLLHVSSFQKTWKWYCITASMSSRDRFTAYSKICQNVWFYWEYVHTVIPTNKDHPFWQMWSYNKAGGCIRQVHYHGKWSFGIIQSGLISQVVSRRVVLWSRAHHTVICQPSLHMWFVNQVCTCDLSTKFAHVICQPSLHNRWTHHVCWKQMWKKSVQINHGE